MADSGSSYNGNEAYFRQLVRSLDPAGQESPARDDFVNALFHYQEAANEATSPGRLTRDSIWAGINLQISRGREEEYHEAAPIFQLSAIWKRWALVASLLIVALGGLYLAQRWAGEQTLAATQQHKETVTLADGSTVTLRPHSTLYQVSDADNSPTLKLTGEAWFDVKENRERTLRILAGDGRVEVTGTRFMVSKWNRRVQVYLESGSITFERLKNQTVFESVALQPGQYSGITRDQGLIAPTSQSIDAYNDWLNNQMVFESRPLEYIFAELEQHFAITIEAPARVLDDSLSGRIFLENADSSLGELQKVLPGRFEKTGTDTYRYHPG